MKALQSLWTSCEEGWKSLEEGKAFRVAVFIWVVYGIVLATIVAVSPTSHSATGEYRKAAKHWWSADQSLYRKRNGYLYLPHFAALYSPYASLPMRLGEPLWRLTIMALLAGALWGAVRTTTGAQAGKAFLLATLLVLPSTFASARNGQTNLPLAALLLLIPLALARERWWLGAALLGLMAILKPIALAPLLIFSVLLPALRLPLAAVLALLAAGAFLHPHPAYVAGEYAGFFKNLHQAGNPKGFTWCDFSGLLHCLGFPLSAPTQFVIRILAGGLTLFLCGVARSRCRPLAAMLFSSAFCALYLCLFNPRTETNSYVLLGVFVALGGVLTLMNHRWKAAFGLVLAAVLLGTENYGNPIFPWTNLWLKPLVALFLVFALTRELFKISKTTAPLCST